MDELEILLSHSFEDIKRSNLILTLLKLSQQYLGLNHTTCEKEYFRYYERLKTLKNKPMTQQKDYLHKKYILKPGHLLYYNNTHYNNDTLSDQEAETAIKRFPALINNFLSEKEIAILKAEAEEKAKPAAEPIPEPTIEPIPEPEVEPIAETELKPEPKLTPKKKKSVKK